MGGAVKNRRWIHRPIELKQATCGMGCRAVSLCSSQRNEWPRVGQLLLAAPARAVIRDAPDSP
jgi:hypothetical protein